MIFYIINRLLQAIPVVFGVLTISFLLMNIVPGDPVRAMVGDYYDSSNSQIASALRFAGTTFNIVGTALLTIPGSQGYGLLAIGLN